MMVLAVERTNAHCKDGMVSFMIICTLDSHIRKDSRPFFQTSRHL